MNSLPKLKEAGVAAYSALIEKARNNPDFKDELVNNSIETFESSLGLNFPPTHKLIVEDQSDSSIIFLNIPARPDFEELELTDEQLELVAGGTSPVTIGAATLICAGAVVAIGAVILVGSAVVAYQIARK